MDHIKGSIQRHQFSDILQRLSKQTGEEKLRLAFKLSQFAQELRAQGDTYDKKEQRHRAGATT